MGWISLSSHPGESTLTPRPSPMSLQQVLIQRTGRETRESRFPWEAQRRRWSCGKCTNLLSCGAKTVNFKMLGKSSRHVTHGAWVNPTVAWGRTEEETLYPRENRKTVLGPKSHTNKTRGLLSWEMVRKHRNYLRLSLEQDKRAIVTNPHYQPGNEEGATAVHC